MESLPDDVLWLILKKVIGWHFIKEYATLNYIRTAACANALRSVPPEKCANCAPITNEFLLEGLCVCCHKLYKMGNIVKTSTSLFGDTWTCGCGTCVKDKYYCSLHRYMNINGSMEKYSNNYIFDNMRTNIKSLEILMAQLSIVDHRFQNLLRSKCIWFDTTHKIWGFRENILV